MDLIRGFTLLAQNARLRRLALIPALASSAAYVLLGIVGWFALAPVAEKAMGEWEVVGRFAALVVYIVAFPIVFFLLGSGFLALVFDPLARGVEEAEGAGADRTPARGVVVKDAALRLLLNVTLGALALVATPFLGPIPGMVLAGIAATLDYTAPASLRRGRTLGPQFLTFVRRRDLGTLAFAVVAGFLSIVPLVGLLVAPALVVGGTLLIRRRDGR